MVSETDLINLYSQRILALAASIPHAERLIDPDATSQKRSPLCGSTVTVDLCVADGKVSAFGQDVKACALGQAAASVVGSAIIGCSIEELEIARDQLLAMLKSDGPVPSAPFEGLEVLLPAKEYKNRHASIMLCIEASLDAFKNA
ncbi:MAG: iron-sulfur cluster assembly scaffold protein [Rhodobacteraceae bacterium]|nr:iron-sulfur cluster assembly scaffold protein [Paracoccaceae bacterium]